MFRRCRYLPFAVLLTLPLMACSNSSSETPMMGASEGDAPVQVATADATAVKPGAPLYDRAEYVSAVDDMTRPDPVILPECQFTVISKENVPSQADGFVEFIGTEVKPGEPVPAGVQVYTHQRTGKQYRKLELGDFVREGDVVAMLDDREAAAQLYEAESALRAAQEDSQGKADLVEATRAALEQAENLRALDVNTKLEVIRAKAQYNNALAEHKRALAEIERYQGSLEVARHRLQMHEIRSKIDGQIVELYRHRGEGIKATENLMLIQNFDKLRIEGLLDAEHESQIQVGMTCEIEPTELRAPSFSSIPHLQRITALAAGQAGDIPVYLTASEDRTVAVWQGRKPLENWNHPTIVRAIACTPANSGVNLAVTGGDDGKVRLWDLANLGKKPVRELDGHHGGILAAAFSPDGQYCATADDRRVIILWGSNNGKKLYEFGSAHRGPITSVQFTPQGRLVSSGRDNTTRVWEIGQDGARLERTFESRSGEVPHLGVSPDGNQLLLDRGPTEMHVLNVVDGRTTQVIGTGTDTTKFTHFATFAPSNDLVLTAASGSGILQLWRLSEHEQGRTTELLRLVCPDGNRPTCGVFVQTPQGGYIVAGTESGRVYGWPTPSEAEVALRHQAQITFISPEIGTDGRRLRVHAEFDNTGDHRLRPGVPASIVIQSEDPGLARE